jgi:hypothetical protein
MVERAVWQGGWQGHGIRANVVGSLEVGKEAGAWG